MSWVGLRAAALVAALLLAVLSRGDALVLAALLALAAWRPLPAVGIVSALVATGWRWASTSLEDIAGAQAVLGPAGVVDPLTAAIAAWLGAIAILLATPDLELPYGAEMVERYGDPNARYERVDLTDLPRGRAALAVVRWLPVLAFSASAALVVAGPSVGGDVWARVLAIAAGVVALTVGRRHGWLRRWRTQIDWAAAAGGLAALILTGLDAPPLEGLLDADALIEGLVVAAAVGLVAWVIGTAALRTGTPDPRLHEPHDGRSGAERQ